MREAIEAVTAADGLIAVTPIFSASYSGLFKSFVDVIDKDALTGCPVPARTTAETVVPFAEQLAALSPGRP
ncbi:NAD(P)H-dependent FMN reductase [Kitasatospora sp. GP30]|nr:NAD(P)H-dependent FMN reductase [Kitasatospora sp. GP30]